MDIRRNYKGCVVEANPEETPDGSRWTESYNIEIHYGGRVEVRQFVSDRTLPSKPEAVAASLAAGRRRVDHSLLFRNNDSGQEVKTDGAPACPDFDIPNDLKVTWQEEESLRPTIQGDADPLTGNGSLRFIKDKRRRRLDELDDEPE